MENKYYIPTIEEFHVGFEYESKETFQDGAVKSQEQFNNAKWIKEVFSNGSSPYVNRALNGKNAENNRCGIRVKYLNKEDIESFGFAFSENYADRPEMGFLLDTNYSRPYTQYVLNYSPENNKLKVERIVNCGTSVDDYLFNGIIKNKSELKKILKQLNIQ